MTYFDLHNHSGNSFDAIDTPEDIILKGISSGLDSMGITDHNYWITGFFDHELAQLSAVREKYKDKIKVLYGMEVSFLRLDGLDPEMLEGYDYCLFEYFINADVPFDQVCRFADSFPCRVGIAHTDMFRYEEQYGVPALEMMAEHNIFWELNVNKDKIHNFREHQYCKDLVSSDYQQNRIKELGVELSVGSDTHDLTYYDPSRVREMCEFIDAKGFKIPDFVK